MNEKVEPSSPTSEAQARHLDRLLDEALQETFPASDPVSICSDDRAPESARKAPPGKHAQPTP